ncbi:hypothetical protein DYB25_010735 [Aphanomyces astaci]|uniref:HTH CENPB-type domain-containing protein n=1 Tax=Aphanomyces astaci TaxID=112090 RepID=A0A397BZG7_APHAT|nr:hypothetical protein DYB25_010735 [Aphanomyces astaci]
MFLSAVTRPRCNDARTEWFDGKIGTLHFTQVVPAARSSLNRPAVTLQDNTRPQVPTCDQAVVEACKSNGWSMACGRDTFDTGCALLNVTVDLAPTWAGPRGLYKPKELDAAMQRVLDGMKGKAVAQDTRIPYNTLMKAVRARKAGVVTLRQRPGPKTVLPKMCEEDLVAWIGAKQQDGNPPDRQAVLVKATQLLRNVNPAQAAPTSGWYKRFRQRHPKLTRRMAQVFSHTRNYVDLAAVERLFETIILTLALLSMVNKTKEDRAAAAKLRASLRIKRGKDSKKLTLSKTALKWASFAATLGLMPLPDGQIRSTSEEVVV